MQPKFIEKDTSKEAIENFDLLVETGIKLLQKFSSKQWTDYNLHDPGVTILEQLCFKLTELAYITAFDIEDILTKPDGLIDANAHSFIDRNKILTCNPVTKKDYRKVLLDNIDYLENVDIIPVTSQYAYNNLKGLYEIKVKVTDEKISCIEKNKKKEKEDIIGEVRKCFVGFRNINEDIIRTVTILKPQDIHITADIIISEDYSPEETLFNIYKSLKTILSPKPKIKQEEDLLQKNIPIESIYNGPLLKNGIIEDGELKDLNYNIETVELRFAASNANGVVSIKKFLVSKNEKGEGISLFKPLKDHFPYIEIKKFAEGINLLIDGYKATINKEKFYEIVKKNNELGIWKKQSFTATTSPQMLNTGKFRNFENYFSIQNNFPAVYGIGNKGISAPKTPTRKAQAKQLKAYLMFFEQVLANYTSQLANIDKLFTTNINKYTATYFTHPLYSVPNAKQILLPNSSQQQWEDFIKNRNNDYIKSITLLLENKNEYAKRKELFFNHIYARFNEAFITYPVKVFSDIYEAENVNAQTNTILKWKALLIQNLADTSYNRTKAFNYLDTDTALIGFEKKIALLLYLQTTCRKRLTAVFENENSLIIPQVYHSYFDESNTETTVLEKWDNGKKLKIAGITKNSKLFAGNIGAEKAFIFKNQNISVLKDGINIKNYKIIPNIYAAGYTTIYKSPSPKTDSWNVVSHHLTKKAATSGLNNLIDLLKKISIDSEGFHCIEHLLLRPPVKSPSFGFKFISENTTNNKATELIVFKNKEWSSFDKRESFISEMIKDAIAADKKTKKNETGVIEDSNAMKIFEQKIAQEIFKNNQSKHIIGKELIAAKNNTNKSYPRFEMLTKLNDSNIIINEDFYNYKMTVVLPKWPARFQDQEFKKFVEELFKNNVPVFLRIELKWFGINKMKQFEDIYFKWLESKKDFEKLEDTFVLSQQMIKLLYDNTLNIVD